jgi:hypothetical protein
MAMERGTGGEAVCHWQYMNKIFVICYGNDI